MSQNSTISIAFKIEDIGGGLKQLSIDADAFRKVMQGTITQAEQLQKSVINFASLAKAFDSVNMTLNQISGAVKGLTDAYAVQEQAETQLETVMRQRMSATEEQTSSLKRVGITFIEAQGQMTNGLTTTFE